MEYKRLTNGKITKDNTVLIRNEEGDILMSQEAFDMFANVYNRLAELEDAIEQGQVIALPCKVGDTVYLVHRDELIIECWTVVEILVEPTGLWLHVRNENMLITAIHSKSRGVCFTREEAEKRLKELQGETKL